MPQLRHRSGDWIQDRYEARKLLGSGAFGSVYACLDREIDVSVAVKELHVLDESGGEREAALKQFRAEATHLSRLRHPNIVSGHYQPHNGYWAVCPVCGFDFPQQRVCPDHHAPLIPVTSRHYLVMEYINGPDLLKLLETRGEIEIERLLRYAKQTASALAHIHAKGFVHRDIKPENIRLRAESDEAVLLDFGIATQGEVIGDKYGTLAQRHTQGGGTIGYAPESPTERRQPDARSDVHAFGMTFAHLLTGIDPTEPEELRRLRQHTPRDFRPEIPAALNDLIVECIDIEASRRPQGGAELLERLENLQSRPQAAPTATQTQSQTQGRGFQGQTQSQNSTPAVSPLSYSSGHYARTVPELAWLLDRYERESTTKLYRGEIENWLNDIGETELARKAQQVRMQYPNRQAQGLETLAQALGLPRPQLSFSTPVIDFGAIPEGKNRTVELRVENRGRGLLFGLLRASHPAISHPGEWEGNRARLKVVFDGFRLRPGKYSGQIELDSSAGKHTIPFEARVKGPSMAGAFFTTLGAGVWGAFGGAMLRTIPFYTDPRPGFDWLYSSSNLTLGWWPIAPLFGLTFWVLAFSTVTLISLFKRSCGLWVGMGLFGTMCALGAGMVGLEALISGDSFLRPYFQPHLGNFASGAWLVTGGVLGALAGALSRPRDLLSTRVIGAIVGFAFVLGLLWLALQGAISGGTMPRF